MVYMKRKILLLLTDVGFDLRDGVPYNNTCEEYCGLYLALEDMGHEPWIVVNNREVRGGKYRVLARADVRHDMFDEVVINRELPNFYGGEMQPIQDFSIKFLIEFQGKVSYYACDPDVPEPGNVGGYLKQVRHKLHDLSSLRTLDGQPMTTEEFRSRHTWDALTPAVHKTERGVMGVYSPYPVQDHQLNTRFKGGTVFVDSWRKSLASVRILPLDNLFFPSEGILDPELSTAPCYVGTNKASRHSRLEQLGAFSEQAERDGMVKLYGKIAKPFKERDLARMGVAAMTELYLKHRLHLVVSHKKQANSGINHRYLMALVMDRVPLFDATLDARRTVCVDDYLHAHCSFTTATDYARAVTTARDPATWPLLRDAVKREKERAFGESAAELVRRTNEAHERITG